MKITSVFLQISLTIICGFASAQVSSQSVIANDKSLAAKISNILAEYYDPKSFGCAILIAKNGKIIYENATGMADIELNVPMTTGMIFRVGSITKQFTAAAILQLKEKRLLDLQDDITKFIPDYPSHGYKITIENLLTHTSGIKDMTEMEQFNSVFQRKDFTPAELIDSFKNQPMDFAPGTKWKYSNSGYLILGYIIEKVSGKSYPQYINDNIFKSLGMEHAYYDNTSAIIKNRASGYKQGQTIPVSNADYISMTVPFSAGALMMTVDDLFKWHEGLYQYKILKKESLDLAFTPFTLSNGEKVKYGYGWGLDSLNGSRTIQHGGNVNGFSAFEIYLPVEDIFVAAFSNSAMSNTVSLSQLVACIAAGKPNVKEITVPENIMNNYTGLYKFKLDGPSTTEIYKKDGKLFLHDTHSPIPWQMHFTTNTDFYCNPVFPNNHHFATDSTGKVTAFIVQAPGYTSTITKIK